MTTLRARLHHVFSAVVAVGLLGLGATDAHATHFRYGTLRWELTNPQPNNPDLVRIKVTTETAWRRSYPQWNPFPVLGATINTQQTVIVQNISTFAQVTSAPLNVRVTSVNDGEDWFVGGSDLIFEFQRSNLPVRVFFQGNARVSNLQDGNADDNFRVEAIMSATPNAASPAASILPIITIAYRPQPAPPARFFIPATDVEGDALTWRITEPASRSQLTKIAPDGVTNTFDYSLSINASTGEVTWDVARELVPPIGGHYYAVQFLVTDSKGAETPVDALLRLIPNSGTEPVALIEGSPNAYAVDVRPNNAVTFTVTGTDVDPGSTVTLTSGALPNGAVMTPSLPTAGLAPVSSTFSWTPTLAQAGNTYPISFAVTDGLGMQDTNSASVRVLANFPPTASCPADAIIEATSAAGASATVNATVNDPDGDGLTVRWSVDGTLVETDTVPAGAGSTVVSLTRNFAMVPAPHVILVEVSDALLTVSCTSNLTVADTTPPVLVVPDDIVQEATGPDGNVVTFVATATDTVDPNPTVTCAPPSGSVFAVNSPSPGATTVTCTAQDAAGNSVTDTFTVRIQDTIAPTITGMPGNMVLEATGPAGAVASWPTPTATDGPPVVDTDVPVTCAPASGSTFAITPPAPMATVTCTATDDSGNSATATFTVRVQDTTPPVISGMSADITTPATGPGGAQVTWTAPTAHDIVDLARDVTCAPPSGSTFPVGTTTVTCEAIDTRGNRAEETFTVTVTFAPPPVFTVSLNPGLLWPPNHKMVDIAVTVSPANATCAIYSVTSNQPQNGTGDGDTDIDWIFSGMDLQLRAERAGNDRRGVGRVYTITVVCFNAAGTPGYASATAIVPHDMRGPR